MLKFCMFVLWTKLDILFVLSCLFSVQFRIFLLSKNVLLRRKCDKKEDTLQFVSVNFVMINCAFNNILGVTSVWIHFGAFVWVQFTGKFIGFNCFSGTVRRNLAAPDLRRQDIVKLSFPIRSHTHVEVLPMCCSSYPDRCCLVSLDRLEKWSMLCTISDFPTPLLCFTLHTFIQFRPLF